MFRAIFAIGNNRTDSLARWKAAGHVLPPVDMRGRHSTRPNATPEATIACIRNHIESFPTTTSHYAYSKTKNVEYLNADLTVSGMWELFRLAHANVANGISTFMFFHSKQSQQKIS